MAGKPDKKAKINPSVTWRKVNDEAVILNLETSIYYSVNQTGTLIWELFTKGKPVEKIGQALAAEYGLSPEEATADTAEFLRTISGLGLTENR